MKSKALVGFTVDSFQGVPASHLLKLLRKVGVEFAEVTASVFDDLEATVAVLDGLKLGLHLPLIAETGYDFSCLHKKEEIDRLISLINGSGRRLNLQYALAHPTEAHLLDSPDEISEAFLFENLNKLEIPVVVENTWEPESGHFAAFFARAESALGDKLLGICFDPPHAYICREDWFEMLQTLYPKIRLLHLSDCTKEEDLHLPFGQGGNLPVDKVLAYLQSQGYSGIVNLEIQPKSLTDLQPLFYSYLLVLRYLNRAKYRSMRLRSSIFQPILRHRLKRLKTSES